jgi:diguanylate cyclase (GGDEF)-like protein
MRTKTTLALTGIWFSLSAIIAFFITGSVLFGARTERNYRNLIDSAAANHAVASAHYIAALEGGFAALAEFAGEIEDADELAAFLDSYAQSQRNVNFIGVNRLLPNIGEGDHADITARVSAIPDDGRLYAVPFQNTPTVEYGLAIRGEIGGNSDTLMIVYSAAAVSSVLESVTLPAGGRLALRDTHGNIIDGVRLSNSLPDIRGEIRRGHSVGESGWTVYAVGNVRAVRETASDALNGLFAITFLLCAAGLVMTLLITRRLGIPLDDITKAMSQLRRGDRAVRITVAPRDARNEYGELAARFNDFADALSGKATRKDEKPLPLRISRVSLDALTGVYSRRAVTDYINAQIMGTPATPFTPFAVIYVTLKEFTDFNDKRGHASGDLALRFAARELQEAISEHGGGGEVGRYGGDEFVLAVRGSTEKDAKDIAKQIMKRLKSGYTEDSSEKITIVPEIGIAMVTNTPAEAAGVISAAINNMRGNRK